MKVAIVCDDYKLPKFREELKKMDIVFTESPFVSNTTTIAIFINQNQMDDIRKMCIRLEIDFKQSN